MNKATIMAALWSHCSSGSGRISDTRFSCRRGLLCCFWLLGGLLLAGSTVQAKTQAGDILVIDAIGGWGDLGALLLVNPTSGQRRVLSNFGNPLQGPLGESSLTGVAVGATGKIFVTAGFAGESGHGALFRVNPNTRRRTLLSDFGQGDIQGDFYYGLAVNATGEVIANLYKLPMLKSTLVRIDPKTDERALITDFTNPAQGEIESDRFITDLVLESSGKILIGTARASGQLDAAIFRVDSVTGVRSLLSDFANPAQGADAADLWGSHGLAIETSGQILAASGGTTAAPRNLLLRIDPTTGQRTVLSDFDDPAQGNIGAFLSGVAVEESGAIIVGAIGEPFDGTFSLFRVEPATGQRTLLSDSNNPAQGRSFSSTVYITVVPQDSDAEGHD
jgi:hypothetical protein